MLWITVPTVPFKNRRFGGVYHPEGLENAPDILTKNFLEISALTIRAGRSKNHRIFLEISKSGGANLVACDWRDGLGLATSTSLRPLRSLPPLGQASFLPGMVGKGVISGEGAQGGHLSRKIMRHGGTRGFGVARRFEAADAADGWLDDRREGLGAQQTPDAAAG
jgi:hypothetical protein